MLILYRLALPKSMWCSVKVWSWQVLELRAAAPEAQSAAQPPYSISQAAAAVSFDDDGEVS